MKILLVSWMLLVFGASLNSAHYIRKLEDADSEVYRVTEDHSGIRIVNPKPEKPTLREVLYYHIVERPYGKQEPVITERSFTNSHGLQFLKDASSETEHNDEQEDDGKYHEDDYVDQEEREHENKLEDKIQDEEGQDEYTEAVSETKPLTDKDVKEAYKHRSYLFDQLRQRYSPVKRMIVPNPSNRRKREAALEELPDGPELPESSPKDAYVQPNTYGMNLDSDGGYVWNNMNNPPVFYEVGQSTGNPNEGQGVSESVQSQESQPPPEIYVPPVTETTNSGSSEDIYVSTDRQPAPLIEEVIAERPENVPAVVEESEELVNNPDENVEPTESSERPIVEPPLNDDTVSEDYNPGVEKPEYENPEKPVFGESGEPVETPADSGLETVASSTESSDGDEIKVIPKAPTLPPLNYDSLPDYIRDAISSTEKSAETQEQPENSYVNPQLGPEDRKKLEDKMEDIFATAQPVEDIPKTYGVNLTGDGGKVWNEMVNSPVSHDVGSTDKKEEEPKAPEPIEQPTQENQEEPKPEQPEIEVTEDNKEAEVPEIPEVPELENPETVPENDDVDDKPALPIEPTPENKEPTLEPGTSEGEIAKPDEAEEAGDEVLEPKPDDERKPDIMSELLKSDEFWKWLGEWTATYMELLEKHMRKIVIQEICNREKTGTDMCLLNDQPEDSGLIIKDGKIILDGKELPVTHNSNFDELRRGYNNRKDKENYKVEATTIYGNSVGNEKVNNVFIFNAVDAEKILGELKPGNDSKIDIIIDEREKEDEHKGEVTEKIESEIDEVKGEEIPLVPIKDQKEIEDKPISSKLESDKESTEKIPLGE